jgi:hypothetical protein
MVTTVDTALPGLIEENERLRAALNYCDMKARCLRIALDHPIDMKCAAMQGAEIIHTVEAALNPPQEAEDGQE